MIGILLWSNMWDNELFENYELLLPDKFDGGYLILTLYQRIESKSLPEQFGTDDIRLILEEIAQKYKTQVPQSERVIRQLLHYLLRNVPEQYGKFELSDHAIRLVELMRYKLDNPYRNYPLKETFEKYFFLKTGEIKTVTDLDVKFGKDFTAGHKRIINDHLFALEDELQQAYEQLNNILETDEESATILVKKFTDVFRKFGERAEDITYAISSKDGFLKRLRNRVDEFYQETDIFRQAQSDEEIQQLRKHQQDWQQALTIQNDLETFFKKADSKIERIRRQIFKASTKLSELQESFSRSSTFRLSIKKLFHACLEQATGKRQEIRFDRNFPLKTIVAGRLQLFHPVYYDFASIKNNHLKQVVPQPEYEAMQRIEIEREIRRQEFITQLIGIGKDKMISNDLFHLSKFLQEISDEQKDAFIIQNVALDLLNFAGTIDERTVEIEKEIYSFTKEKLSTWTMKIRKQ